MEFEETMVDDNESELDEVVEEPEEVEEESLDTLEDESDEQKPEPKAKAEPGYVQKRIDKALERERESMRKEIMEQIESQYAPIKERLLEMDAQELVRSGEFKSIERAKEYLKLKQGLPVEAPQPRQENGQFAPKTDPATEARIEMLQHQRERIIKETGNDPADLFNSDEEIKEAIINGEMDFYDVAKQMRQKKRPPSPMRSPNGASGTNPNAIDSMSDAQFEKMEKRIKEGARYTLR